MIDRSLLIRRRPRAAVLAVTPRREDARRIAAALFLAAGLACAALAALAAIARADDDTATSEPFPVLVAQPAKVVSLCPVSWPQSARETGIGGTVLVMARVGRDGRVRETQVVSSIPELDAAAIDAARRYQFEAARDTAGAEVESWVLLPLRFDASVPVGVHGNDPIPTHLYSDLERSFESDVETLRPYDVAPPNARTIDLHLAIMRDANLLEVIPPPGADAIQAFLRGDSLTRSAVPAKRDGRKAAWAEAAHLAPWWPLPYRRLAAVAIADRDFDTAAACANVILAARANDEEALAILKRTGQLRRASAPKKTMK